MSGATILSGALSEADLPSVLGVTSLGRQTIRLEVFTASGAPIGHAVLKAGRVLLATAGVHTGRAALKVILSAPTSARFRIGREAASPDGEPIALIDDVLRSLPALPSSIPPPAPTRIRVMDGSLRDFDVATLLQTVGSGRQYIELDVMDNDRRTIGSVLLKAGKILSAQSGSAEGIAAVRDLLEAPSDFGFAVYRLDARVGDIEPLGSIAQVLFDAEPRERRVSPPPPRTPVLRGSLAEFDVPTILFTLAVARQFNCVELHDRDGIVGTIYAKAGMVISAATPQLQGLAAFQSLVRSPSQVQFSVFRVHSEVVEEPLGSIYQLLAASEVSHHSLVAVPEFSAVPERREFTNSDRLTSVSQRVAIMVGSTTDFSVRTLMETLTEIRQRTVVELIQGDAMIGSVHVKAGKLLAARTETMSGIPAFRWLLSTPGHLQFRVFRSPGESGHPAEPISSLYDLLSIPTAAGAVGIGVEPEATHRARAQVPRYVWIATGIIAAAAAFLLIWRPPPRVSSTETVASVETASQVTSIPQAGGGPAARESDVTVPAVTVPPAAAAVPAPAATVPAPAASVPPPVVVTVPAGPVPTMSQTLSVWKAQVMLRKLGFVVGPIDNIYGKQTKAAVQEFQRAVTLPPTGILDEATVQLLTLKSPLKD